MRAFIALTLPDSLKDRLVAVQEELRRDSLARVRWVTRAAMHLTVRFLGDVNEEQAAILAAVVRAEEVRWTQPLKLEIGGLGAFPSVRRPNVIWVGVAQHEGLTDLAERMELAATDVGLEPSERRFQAHLTLGRVKEISADDLLLAGLSRIRVDPTLVSVTQLTLSRSELSKSGPRYTTLEQSRWGGGSVD